MIETFQEILSYQFNQRALLAALMIGFLNGYIGGYVVLRKGALFAGALSHTLFPGIAVGALIAGLNPYSALVGAFVMALVVGLGSQGIASNSRIDREAAMAILYTGATAGGLIVLQRLGTYVRVEDYLFGNILRVSNWDLWFMFMTGLVVLSVALLLQRPLLVFIFSNDLAAAHGIPNRRSDYLLAGLVVITMVTSLQAVGALLAIGLLVAPAATMYLFVNSPRAILWGGGIMGMLIAAGSIFITNLLDVQTGPAMVILLAVVFLLGFVLSPRYGLLAKFRAGHAMRHR
jgi:ABC-type Mn2+/Zn2+ transport system permease subunit